MRPLRHREPCTFARPCRACRDVVTHQRTESLRRVLRQGISMFEGLLLRGDLAEDDRPTTRRWVQRARRILRASEKAR